MFSFIKIALIPFLPLYALIVYLRNMLFDLSILKQKKAGARVISIGNITVGGSGKTPMVIYLLDLLKKLNRRPGVLSRGYGRLSSGYRLVSNGQKIFTTVEICGDEIYQTVMETETPGAVSENRAAGAERLIEETGVDVVVLDDGFQHRWLYRDIDILVCEQRFLLDERITNKSLLPLGNMREPFSSIRRADAVVINRKFSEDTKLPEHLNKYLAGKPVFKGFYKAICFVDVKRNEEHSIEEFKGQKSLVVSGIANPYSLFNILKQSGVNTDNQLIFRDHKQYSLQEINELRKKFYTVNAHSVITTHKDAVKLIRFANEFDDIDIFYLKIKMEIDDEGNFISFLQSKIEQSTLDQ